MLLLSGDRSHKRNDVTASRAVSDEHGSGTDRSDRAEDRRAVLLTAVGQADPLYTAPLETGTLSEEVPKAFS